MFSKGDELYDERFGERYLTSEPHTAERLFGRLR